VGNPILPKPLGFIPVAVAVAVGKASLMLPLKVKSLGHAHVLTRARDDSK